jgi:hypothetical protein
MLRNCCMHHQYFAGKKREATTNILQCIRSFVQTIFKAEKAEKYGAPVYSRQPPITATLPASHFKTYATVES